VKVDGKKHKMAPRGEEENGAIFWDTQNELRHLCGSCESSG